MFGGVLTFLSPKRLSRPFQLCLGRIRLSYSAIGVSLCFNKKQQKPVVNAVNRKWQRRPTDAAYGVDFGAFTLGSLGANHMRTSNSAPLNLVYVVDAGEV
jgi:hypothetical protein